MINESYEPDISTGEIIADPRKLSGLSSYGNKSCIDAFANAENRTKSKTKYEVTKELYDPYDFGNLDSNASVSNVILQIIVVAFGPTLLSIPATFVNVGYAVGICGTVCTVFLYALCMKMVLSTEYELCKRTAKPNLSFVQMVTEAFECGPSWLRWFSAYVEAIIYAVFVCVWAGGNSIVFLLASENVKNSYDYFAGADINIRVVMACLIAPLLLLCWIPNLELLLPVSFMTNAINVACICTIAYYATLDFYSIEFEERQAAGAVTAIPLFVGLQLFTINATGLMLPLKNEMKRPKKFNSKFGVITICYVAVAAMYTAFGALCYLKYGAATKSSVIRNLPETTLCKFMIALYGVGNCCFYPLVAYVTFDIIWNCRLKAKYAKSTKKFWYEYACRSAVCLSSIVFAYAVPNIELFISFTGTIGTSIDSLIVPALAETLVFYKERGWGLYVKNGIIATVGVVLIVTGTIDCTSQLLKAF